MSNASAPLPAPERFNLARYCLADNVRRHPDKTALIVVGEDFAEERWTFGEFDLAVRRLAGGLRSLGLEDGARIMIRMANDSNYALMYFAAIAAGYVALPSSAQLTAEEAEFLLEDSGASVITLSEGLELDHDVPDGVRLLRPDDVAASKEHAPIHDYADTLADDPAYLIYTSGTTGHPKGVLHAQRAAWGRRPMYQGWQGLEEEDIILHAGQFNWTYTLGVGLVDPWANGATALLYNGPKEVTVWPVLIERYKATVFATVPTLYRQILKYCDIPSYDFSSLRHGLTAGEALSPALLDAWRGEVGTDLYEALGMSECSTYISSSPSVPIRPGSPGRPQAGRRVAILAVDGGETPLPPGEVGLLAVHRSDPGLMLGYWNRPEEEAEMFRGDWFIGGDLAALDEDGYLWYHGRNNDLMNAMGYRVSPVEVEGALARHPAVAEVAVTELAVREDLSVIAAFVVSRLGLELEGADLLAFAAEHLAPYKIPRQVIFTDHLPRTANGKVMRRALQKQ